MNNNLREDTMKSSSGSLKREKFKDLSTPSESTIQTSNMKSKKLTRCPRSSATTKQTLQCENSNDPGRYGEFQVDKSNMMPEISLSASGTQCNTDSHETKQGFKQLQTVLNKQK